MKAFITGLIESTATVFFCLSWAPSAVNGSWILLDGKFSVAGVGWCFSGLSRLLVIFSTRIHFREFSSNIPVSMVNSHEESN